MALPDWLEPMAATLTADRFTDPAWEQNPAYWGLRQAYLAWRQYGMDLVRAADLDGVQEGKAELAFSFLHDALSPTNFPLTNPAVLNGAGDPIAYTLVPGPTPTLLAHPASSIGRRGVTRCPRR